MTGVGISYHNREKNKMADQFDQASDLEQLDRDRCIAAARVPDPALEATGFCLWCEEVVAPGRRFCDADCRDLWDRDLKLRR